MGGGDSRGQGLRVGSGLQGTLSDFLSTKSMWSLSIWEGALPSRWSHRPTRFFMEMLLLRNTAGGCVWLSLNEALLSWLFSLWLDYTSLPQTSTTVS